MCRQAISSGPVTLFLADAGFDSDGSRRRSSAVRLRQTRCRQGVADRQRRRNGRRLRWPFQDHRQQDDGILRHTVAGEQRRLCIGACEAEEAQPQKGDTTRCARVRGDGREYTFNLYVPRALVAFSYRASFKTKKGEWIEIRAPLDKFVATSFGRVVPDEPLNPSEVNAIGFLLGDKKAGPFKLEVEWIKVTKAK